MQKSSWMFNSQSIASLFAVWAHFPMENYFCTKNFGVNLFLYNGSSKLCMLYFQKLVEVDKWMSELSFLKKRFEHV